MFALPQAATKKQKYEKISDKKMKTQFEVLCKVSARLSLRHTLPSTHHLSLPQAHLLEGDR